MCGDAGAHGSGAQDSNFMNALHGKPLLVMETKNCWLSDADGE
jgi:hypothetical protein